jgi:hypothetical protein
MDGSARYAAFRGQGAGAATFAVETGHLRCPQLDRVAPELRGIVRLECPGGQGDACRVALFLEILGASG